MHIKLTKGGYSPKEVLAMYKDDKKITEAQSDKDLVKDPKILKQIV